MNNELKKELENFISVVETELKQGEEWKKIEAMRVLIPDFDGLIKAGEFLGRAEIAKKVLESHENKTKEIIEILEKATTAPCLEIGCDCENCDDETANDSGENTCMQYGIEKALELLKG